MERKQFNEVVESNDTSDCIDELRKSFQRTYQSEPQYILRVPGRVNLIGEHIDYNGFDVCPMAIKQSVFVALKYVSDEKTMCISNADTQYPSIKISTDDIVINKTGVPNWYDYPLCGFKGIFEHMNLAPNGFIFHVYGNIPPAAGLSSSSALVCASVLAGNTLYDLGLNKNSMVGIAVKAERYIGTEGGGMDQAIIFNGYKGRAMQVAFNPISFREIVIPPEGTFVIAHSMVTKNKAASSDFNMRVLECRLGTLIIAKKFLPDWMRYSQLKELQKAMKCDLEHIIHITKDTLHEGKYTKQEILKILDMSEKELSPFFPANTRIILAKEDFEIELRNRVLHVYEEARHVEQFCHISRTSKSLMEMGNLMVESHTSLQLKYECSHPELDKLVTISCQLGAYGARLTGAGWGGCMIALVPTALVPKFVADIKNIFYREKNIPDVDLDRLVFATQPEDGARVVVT